MTVTEILGFITGAINVWLLARQSIWNWPVGLANYALYIVVFVRAGLYGDASLQLVYTVLAIYGWIAWLRPGPQKAELGVSRTPRGVWAWLIPAAAIGTVFFVFFLKNYTDSQVPGWDGFTTALSLAALYGQCKKYVESWWLWIAVDVVYIPLYVIKGLWLTSGLYLVFLILSIVGLREWMRSLGSARPESATAAA